MDSHGATSLQRNTIQEVARLTSKIRQYGLIVSAGGLVDFRRKTLISVRVLTDVGGVNTVVLYLA